MKAYLLHESLNKDQTGMCGAVIKSLMQHGMHDVIDVPLGHEKAALFFKQYPQVASQVRGDAGPFLVMVGPNNARVFRGAQIFKVIEQMTAVKRDAPGQTMELFPRPGPGMPVAPDSIVQPQFQGSLYGPGGDALANAVDDTEVYATNYGLYNNAFESPDQRVDTRGNKFLERQGHLPPSARPEPLPLTRCPPWRVGNRGYPCFKDGQSLAVSDGMEVPLLAGPNNWKSHFFDNATIGGIYTNFGPFTTPNSFDTDVYDRPFVTPWKRGNQEQSQRQFSDATAYRRAYLSYGD